MTPPTRASSRMPAPLPAILEPMADLTFSQSERRTYLVPSLIALAVLGLIGGYVLWRMPSRIADVTVTHTAILPTHTVFKSDTKLVGAHDEAQDDLYVLTTVRIQNNLKIPLFLSDITATLTGPDNTVLDTSALEKNDLANVYVTFPKLIPLSGPPLLRESTIAPLDHVEGMVLLHFPLTEADWNQRKAVTLTIAFYHQPSLTIPFPK